MVNEIQVATANLWQLVLKNAVGGSGVNAVDIIVVDLKTGDGIEGRGFRQNRHECCKRNN